MLSDAELTELRSFWIWEPLKEKWDFIRDWEEHKVEAMRSSRSTLSGGAAACVKKRRVAYHYPDGFSEGAPPDELYPVRSQ
jgi:hypothetical protein